MYRDAPNKATEVCTLIERPSVVSPPPPWPAGADGSGKWGQEAIPAVLVRSLHLGNVGY